MPIGRRGCLSCCGPGYLREPPTTDHCDHGSESGCRNRSGNGSVRNSQRIPRRGCQPCYRSVHGWNQGRVRLLPGRRSFGRPSQLGDTLQETSESQRRSGEGRRSGIERPYSSLRLSTPGDVTVCLEMLQSRAIACHGVRRRKCVRR